MFPGEGRTTVLRRRPPDRFASLQLGKVAARPQLGSRPGELFDELAGGVLALTWDELQARPRPRGSMQTGAFKVPKL